MVKVRILHKRYERFFVILPYVIHIFEGKPGFNK